MPVKDNYYYNGQAHRNRRLHAIFGERHFEYSYYKIIPKIIHVQYVINNIFFKLRDVVIDTNWFLLIYSYLNFNFNLKLQLNLQIK